MNYQHTLQHSVHVGGVGLHSGAPVTLTLKPAKEGRGIMFRRMDVTRGTGVIPARFDKVADTWLGTRLSNRHGVTVSTVEHLMAALWGMGIDNVLIELNGPEVPILDGSAEPFIELIRQAGVKRQDAPQKRLRMMKEIEVSYQESKAVAQPLEGGLVLDVEIEYPLVPRQRAVFDFRHAHFNEALAAARTFCFEHEVEYMRSKGLARGGSLENAVVMGKEGVLNEEGLRYTDELLRHKALDCVGDLYLAGYRVEGLFRFEKPGHGINNALLRAIFADKTAWKLVSADSIRHCATMNERPAAYF